MSPVEKIYTQDGSFSHINIQDNRSCLNKVVDFVLSIFREIGYIFYMAYQYIFPSFSYDQCDKEITDKRDSKGLFVLLHGLHAHPSMWNPHIQLLDNHSQFDTFVPFIPKKGNCSLKESVDPIFEKIHNYTKKYPNKPLSLLGVSNGSRIATKLEVMLREKAPSNAVKVSTIAGVHLGSKMMHYVKKICITRCFHRKELQEELSYKSETAISLLKEVRSPIPKDVAERSYQFFASTEDLLIYHSDSSLPHVDKDESYHIIHGHGHTSIVGAVAKEQIDSCISWMKRFQIEV